jgi:hypothetical protein
VWFLALFFPSLIVVLILALCLPVDFIFRGQVGAGSQASLAVRYAGFKIPISGKAGKAGKKKVKKPAAKKPASRMRRWEIFRILWRTPGLKPRLLRFLRYCLRAVRWKKAEIRCAFGFEDPADTGLVYGYICPFLYGLKFPDNLSMEISPVFDRSLFRLYAGGGFRIIPLQMVSIGLRFAFSRPVFSAITALSKAAAR